MITSPKPANVSHKEALKRALKVRSSSVIDLVTVASAGRAHHSFPRQYEGLRRLMRRIRAGGAERDPIEYAQRCFAQISPHVRGSTALELGPGLAGGASGLFAQAGCDAHAIDILDLSQSDLVQHGAAVLRPRVTCLRGSAECLPFCDESFDFIFSVACFEHFRDPIAAVNELRRLLKPGGRTVHQIDLRDHRHFDDPLRFLQFGDRIWTFMHPPSFSMYQNRWRLSQYVSAFAEAGFSVSVEVNKKATSEQLRTLRFAAPRFHKLAADDMVALGCLLIADKTAEA